MSTEKTKKIGEQIGYSMAAMKLIEEAVLLEQAEQENQMAINVCLKLARRLRTRADELQTKAVELMMEDETNFLYIPSAESEAKNRQRLGYRLSQCLKVINHIAEAVGCKDDPMSCWESVEELVSRVKGSSPMSTTIINLNCTKEQAKEQFNKDIEKHIVICDIGDYWKNSDLSEYKTPSRAGRIAYETTPFGEVAVFEWQESGAVHSIFVRDEDLVVVVGGAS